MEYETFQVGAVAFAVIGGFCVGIDGIAFFIFAFRVCEQDGVIVSDIGQREAVALAFELLQLG